MSLMEHLLDTMPLDGARQSTELFRKKGNYYALELGKYATFVPPGKLDSRRVGTKLILQPSTRNPDPEYQKIWSFLLDPDPSQFTALDVAVRDDDYKRYRVLDRVGFGIEKEPGQFKRAVEVTISGTTIELPLSKEFLFQTWTTSEGVQVDQDSVLWPLLAWHDVSAMHVFVFELHGTTPTPVVKRAGRDGRISPSQLQRFLTVAFARPEDGGLVPWENLVGSRLPAEATSEEDESEGTPIMDGIGSALGAMLATSMDDFLAADDILPPKTGRTSGVVGGQSVDIALYPPVIVVTCSLTCCKERKDFEPGQVLGAGRVYPHIMFISSVDIERFDAAIQLDRPPATTIAGVQRACHEDMHSRVSATYFVDSNPENRTIGFPSVPLPDSLPVPLWGNLFSYNLRRPYETFGVPRRFHCVRNDRATERLAPNNGSEPNSLVHRQLPRYMGQFSLSSTTLSKVPRQGAFDNIHLAPPMKVDATHVFVTDYLGKQTFIEVPEEKRSFFDDIGMAPTCPHDCFHTHWRWASGMGQRFASGWGKAGPHTVPGAPMVPLNQEVDTWLRSEARFTYASSSNMQPALQWLPIMHHGSAYGLSAGISRGILEAALLAFEDVGFSQLGANGHHSFVPRSWAQIYWRLQNVIRDPYGTPSIERQISVLDADKAYDL